MNSGGGRPGRSNPYAKEQAQQKKKQKAHYDEHKYDGSDIDASEEGRG